MKKTVAENKVKNPFKDAVHVAHCCQAHGCTYGDGQDCPVESGRLKQAYPCEYCRPEWGEAARQRSSDGNLTKLAMALDSLAGNGCDCGTDEDGTCLACRCEAALREQYDEITRLWQEVSQVIVRSQDTTGVDAQAEASGEPPYPFRLELNARERERLGIEEAGEVAGAREVDDLRSRFLSMNFIGKGQEVEKPAEPRARPEPDAEQELDPYRLTWADKLALVLLVIVVAVVRPFEWAHDRYVKWLKK